METQKVLWMALQLGTEKAQEMEGESVRQKELLIPLVLRL
jgi:hypothetical protein